MRDLMDKSNQERIFIQIIVDSNSVRFAIVTVPEVSKY